MNGAPIMCKLHVMYSGTKITKKHAAFSQEPQSSIKKHANMLHCNVTFIHSSHSLGAICQPLSCVLRIQLWAKIFIVLASKEDTFQFDTHIKQMRANYKFYRNKTHSIIKEYNSLPNRPDLT